MLETTIAGSLPRPDWLAEPEKLKGGWKLSGEELEARQTPRCGGVDQAPGRRRHRHRDRRRAVPPALRARLPRAHRRHRLEQEDPMGIRDNRYDLEVPTVTGELSRPHPVHLDEVRVYCAASPSTS